MFCFGAMHLGVAVLEHVIQDVHQVRPLDRLCLLCSIPHNTMKSHHPQHHEAKLATKQKHVVKYQCCRATEETRIKRTVMRKRPQDARRRLSHDDAPWRVYGAMLCYAVHLAEEAGDAENGSLAHVWRRVVQSLGMGEVCVCLLSCGRVALCV